MYCLKHYHEMFRLANWFLGRLNSKKSIDLLYFYNNHNNLAHGRMFKKLDGKATLIVV
jgi:hypothetical protein